jgi:tetratricopeptide (TPR) repeat protein
MRKLTLTGTVLAALAAATCSGPAPRPVAEDPAPEPPKPEATLPRAPGAFAPSFMELSRPLVGDPAPDGETVDGAMLSDVDTCSTCHPDVADQWGASAHSFASFNNPIYRVNVELARTELGKAQSQHCGGCHDISLQVDGLMLGDIPPDDLRSHSGVTCRLCHGIDQVTSDGNGSYVLARAPIGTPDVDDPASVQAHRDAATVKPLGTELCVGCHRGFLSPDVDVPVHMSGIDEPTFWRSSAYTGSGVGRVDKVEKKTCIDCHMKDEAASADEVAAEGGVVASHRFLGGHSWMAGMRGDAEQLRRTRAMLEGVASIDVQPAPVAPDDRTAFDVVVRNLLVGHRFPGGVNDVQDTWIEVEVFDARGRKLATSGLRHEKDADDEEAHVLRSYPAGEDGRVLEEHELPRFRGLISNHTIAARDAIAVRYTLEVPAAAALPLRVDARLRHRSRSLRFQREVCEAARTATGRAFIEGTRAARDADLDPCKAQPITEIAKTSVALGAPSSWEEMYEHGMALTSVVTERLDEPRAVLEAALAAAPADDTGNWARAAIQAQLGIVAGRQGRTEDALALLDEARKLLPADKQPPVLDFAAADALSRVWRWEEAEGFAERATEKAPLNTLAWVMLARARGSLHDDRGALEAARRGLAISPRDPDLLRSQAAALRGLDPTLADLALAAYDRFRAPDGNSALRMACAASSARCAREREAGHAHEMIQTGR